MDLQRPLDTGPESTSDKEGHTTFGVNAVKADSAQLVTMLKPTPRPSTYSTTAFQFATPAQPALPAAEFNRSEIAKQIRASFDNLVRASPSPQALMTARPCVSVDLRRPGIQSTATRKPGPLDDPVLARLFRKGAPSSAQSEISTPSGLKAGVLISGPRNFGSTVLKRPQNEVFAAQSPPAAGRRSVSIRDPRVAQQAVAQIAYEEATPSTGQVQRPSLLKAQPAANGLGPEGSLQEQSRHSRASSLQRHGFDSDETDLSDEDREPRSQHAQRRQKAHGKAPSEADQLGANSAASPHRRGGMRDDQGPEHEQKHRSEVGQLAERPLPSENAVIYKERLPRAAMLCNLASSHAALDAPESSAGHAKPVRGEEDKRGSPPVAVLERDPEAEASSPGQEYMLGVEAIIATYDSETLEPPILQARSAEASHPASVAEEGSPGPGVQPPGLSLVKRLEDRVWAFPASETGGSSEINLETRQGKSKSGTPVSKTARKESRLKQQEGVVLQRTPIDSSGQQGGLQRESSDRSQAGQMAGIEALNHKNPKRSQQEQSCALQPKHKQLQQPSMDDNSEDANRFVRASGGPRKSLNRPTDLEDSSEANAPPDDEVREGTCSAGIQSDLLLGNTSVEGAGVVEDQPTPPTGWGMKRPRSGGSGSAEKSPSTQVTTTRRRSFRLDSGGLGGRGESSLDLLARVGAVFSGSKEPKGQSSDSGGKRGRPTTGKRKKSSGKKFVSPPTKTKRKAPVPPADVPSQKRRSTVRQPSDRAQSREEVSQRSNTTQTTLTGDGPLDACDKVEDAAVSSPSNTAARDPHSGGSPHAVLNLLLGHINQKSHHEASEPGELRENLTESSSRWKSSTRGGGRDLNSADSPTSDRHADEGAGDAAGSHSGQAGDLTDACPASEREESSRATTSGRGQSVPSGAAPEEGNEVAPAETGRGLTAAKGKSSTANRSKVAARKPPDRTRARRALEARLNAAQGQSSEDRSATLRSRALKNARQQEPPGEDVAAKGGAGRSAKLRRAAAHEAPPVAEDTSDDKTQPEDQRKPAIRGRGAARAAESPGAVNVDGTAVLSHGKGDKQPPIKGPSRAAEGSRPACKQVGTKDAAAEKSLSVRNAGVKKPPLHRKAIPAAAAEAETAANSAQPALQVSRSGRIRAPPVAFWANQSLRRDPKSGAVSLQMGFKDQIANATQGNRGHADAKSSVRPSGNPSKAPGLKDKLQPKSRFHMVVNDSTDPASSGQEESVTSAEEPQAKQAAKRKRSHLASADALPAAKAQRVSSRAAHAKLQHTIEDQSTSTGEGQAEPKKMAGQRKKVAVKKGTKKTDKADVGVEAGEAEPLKTPAVRAAAELQEGLTEGHGTEEVTEEDEWTKQQVTALQSAYLCDIDPMAQGFWQKVARRVSGGKTAQACQAKYNSLYGPTPAPKPPKARKRPAVGGADKKLTKVAKRKIAREARWQQQAADMGCEDAEDSPTADLGATNLDAARERRDKADRYLDALLRRRGSKGLSFAAGLTRASGHPPPAARNRVNAELVGRIAGMVAGHEEGPESDDDEEKDEYFSDVSE